MAGSSARWVLVDAEGRAEGWPPGDEGEVGVGVEPGWGRWGAGGGKGGWWVCGNLLSEDGIHKY